MSPHDIVVNLAKKDPSTYEEWIHAISAPGLYCQLCGAIVAEGTLDVSMQAPMPPEWHNSSCPWRQAIEYWSTTP